MPPSKTLASHGSMATPTAPREAALDFAPDAATLERAIASLEEIAGGGGAIDAETRRNALARYGDLPVPGGRPGRSWHYDYTKLRYDGLTWSSGRRSIPAMPQAADARRLDDDASPDNLATANAGGLFHVGATALEARAVPHLDPRVTVVPLADALVSHRAALDVAFGRIVDWRADRYVALATAFQNCGAFVHVPAGVQLDEPIVLVFANYTARAAAVFPHIVVVLGEHAKASVLERHVGEGEPFICGTVEAAVGVGADLNYTVVQQAPEGARTFMSRGARCDDGATMRWQLAELGADLARTTLETKLEGEGARGEIGALFFNTAMQHVDLSTVVRHNIGHTTSGTVVRSAANDRGQGRYLGNIIIVPHAHGSDASLRDDALLLSKHAHIDSIPALEIAANDVRAFHGATVGSIDDEALFYVQSRGIARREAERMIALGFFEPAVARFPGDALRNEVRTALDAKLDDATEPLR